MPFPSHELTPTGGNMDCHVFENALTGMPRDLYWSVTIEFAPLKYAGETWNPTCTVEWLRLNQRDFRSITSVRLNLPDDDPTQRLRFT